LDNIFVMKTKTSGNQFLEGFGFDTSETLPRFAEEFIDRLSDLKTSLYVVYLEGFQ